MVLAVQLSTFAVQLSTLPVTNYLGWKPVRDSFMRSMSWVGMAHPLWQTSKCPPTWRLSLVVRDIQSIVWCHIQFSLRSVETWYCHYLSVETRNHYLWSYPFCLVPEAMNWFFLLNPALVTLDFWKCIVPWGIYTPHYKNAYDVVIMSNIAVLLKN